MFSCQTDHYLLSWKANILDHFSQSKFWLVNFLLGDPVWVVAEYRDMHLLRFQYSTFYYNRLVYHVCLVFTSVKQGAQPLSFSACWLGNALDARLKIKSIIYYGHKLVTIARTHHFPQQGINCQRFNWLVLLGMKIPSDLE